MHICSKPFFWLAKRELTLKEEKGRGGAYPEDFKSVDIENTNDQGLRIVQVHGIVHSPVNDEG